MRGFADAVTVKTESGSDAANTTVNQESFKRWSKILEFIDNLTNFRIFCSLDLVHAGRQSSVRGDKLFLGRHLGVTISDTRHSSF